MVYTPPDCINRTLTSLGLPWLSPSWSNLEKFQTFWTRSFSEWPWHILIANFFSPVRKTEKCLPLLSSFLIASICSRAAGLLGTVSAGGYFKESATCAQFRIADGP